jgi:predicted dehydrogenase/threonine dehydrogenase-like Zn-dependent dehydrogenase
MKQLLQNLRDGKTEIVEVPVPTPKPGMVLVRTVASLVSAGTERMLVEFAEKSLLGKARSRPDLVRQVVDKARREGLLTTVEAAFNRLDQPMPLGYSSAGVIVELGKGIRGYKIGQRVACAGGGYAVHAEYAIVPQNLIAPLPDNVDFEQGAFGTLGSIALHGFRLARPQVGETVVVIGLGLLGLLTVGVARAAGCKVLGVDLDVARVEIAKQMGAEAVLREQGEESAMAFSSNKGADIVLICADTDSNDPVELAGEVARERGRVVAVGVVGMDLPRRVYFQKELDFIVSRSYGPGRYDHTYEEGGQDYPYGYVRWTAGRNLEAFVNLLGESVLDLSPIISHQYPIGDAAQAYELITGKRDEDFLGVLLTYPQGEADIKEEKTVIVHGKTKGVFSPGRVNLGVLGAGIFAGAVMLPALKANKQIDLVGIASASGLSARHAAKKFGFSYATSDVNKVVDDPDINTLAILTRHYLHAPQALAGLRAGKHVFVEKPLAIKPEELDELVEELEKPDTPLLMVGFNRRFAPLAVELKDFVDQRYEPLVAHYRVNAGFLPPEHWHHDLEQGGGRIISEGCHFVDFLTWLVGQPPVSVSAQGLPDKDKYFEDNVVMTFTFADGSVGTVSYLANGDKSLPKERLEVFSGGRIAILDDYRTLENIHNGRRRARRSRLRQDKGHRAEWQSFVKAISESGEPPIPYRDLITVMRATFAAVEALHSEKTQTIDAY